MTSLWRRVMTLTVASACLAVPASAGAAVTNPIPIPKVKVASSKGAHFQLKRGNQLSIVIDNSKAGNRLAKKFSGKVVFVECYGMDASNTVAYDLMATAKWKKNSRSLNATLKRKIVPAQCQIGLAPGAGPGVFFGIFDLQPDPTKPRDAQYAAQFKALEDINMHLFSALSRLVNDKNVPEPTPQQLIDELAAGEATYVPPLPLAALTGDGHYLDATQIGVWTDADDLRVNQTLADGSTVGWSLLIPGMS